MNDEAPARFLWLPPGLRPPVQMPYRTERVFLLVGIAALFAGYESFDHAMPAVMTAVLVVVGVLLPTLAHFSWRHSRAAWSYLLSLTIVFGIVTFFGAPKVRNALDIGFWTAMIVPGVLFVTVTALAMVRTQYRAAS